MSKILRVLSGISALLIGFSAEAQTFDVCGADHVFRCDCGTGECVTLSNNCTSYGIWTYEGTPGFCPVGGLGTPFECQQPADCPQTVCGFSGCYVRPNLTGTVHGGDPPTGATVSNFGMYCSNQPTDCYDGPPETRDVGECHGGYMCSTGGCRAQVLPTAERCNGLDNDCNGIIGDVPGGCDPNPPPDCKDECCNGDVGGPDEISDPIDLGARASLLKDKDISIAGSLGQFTLQRNYVSDPGAWAFGASVGRAPYDPIPKPFGSSWTSRHSLNWSHSLYSFVYPGGWAPGRSQWYVRNINGAFLQYQACSSGSSACTAAPAAQSQGTTSTLSWTGGGSNGYFVLVDQDGKRYIYASRWIPSYGSQRFFLTRIEDRQYAAPGIPRNLATLDYATPDAGCSDGNPDSGVPYLSSASTADGTRLNFHYRMESAYLGGGYECVLDSIGIEDRPLDGGSPTELPWVQFSYPIYAGLLSSAYWPQINRTESYDYSPSGAQGFAVSSNGTVISTHHQDSNGKVTSVQDIGESLSLVSSNASCGSDYSSAYCVNAGNRQLTYSTASSGDGTGATISLQTNHTIHTTNFANGPRLHQSSYSCTGPACGSVSPGAQQWEWTRIGDGGTAVQKAVEDKRGNWEAYVYASPDAGIPVQLAEMRSVFKGATDLNGANSLEAVRYGYVYGVNQVQLVDSMERDSVLGDSGATSRTKRIYDLNTNRLKAVIQSGFTELLDGTIQQRYIGTFYFTNQPCSGGSVNDSLGRVLEVHGPCWVNGFESTDCDINAAAGVPVSQLNYWPGSDPSNRRNRLMSVVRYANNNGPSGCGGWPSLTTTYQQYDARGNPTSIVDENDVTATYTYEDDRVKSKNIAGKTTNYAYDNGKLTYIQFPQGNYEVFCYRTGTSGPRCVGGRWTPQMQWKSKSNVGDGSSWSEKVVYTYWPDGTLASESYLGDSSTSEVRLVRKYAADAHRRPTWEHWGDRPGDFSSVRSFDGADNLSGIGLAYNGPPAWCAVDPSTGQPTTTACAGLTYDRANRLAIVDEYPDGTSDGGVRTCMDHDSQGNVAKISVGCRVDQACAGIDGGFSICTPFSNSYKHDDFGNVVEASLPWSSNGSGGAGVVHLEYDAARKVIRKQTPQMQVNGERFENTYDQLGRLTVMTHFWTLPTPGNEVLYRLYYDLAGGAPGAACPQPANTLGRLRMRDDSFGQTWYQYDSEGRAVSEIRLRQGATDCTGDLNSHPHTNYSYTLNGNLAQINYPLGRTVNYIYGSEANTDRVSGIDVSVYDGGGWNVVHAITSVLWEPYGGLRGYQLTHSSSGTNSAVEYLLGDNAEFATSGCSSNIPSRDSSDHTGRLRALWVSSGPLILGSETGDVYKRLYTWRADQVTQTETCLLGATTARTEQYAYDQLLRLTQQGRPDGNFALTGGIPPRSYGYDARSNRSSASDDAVMYNLSFDSQRPDLLLQRTVSTGNPWQNNYAFDRDGRLTDKGLAPASTGYAYHLTFSYGPTASGTTDSVFKAVSIDGASYGYWFDTLGRRRLKTYPTTRSDEFFYDIFNQMVSDRGNSSIIQPLTAFPIDDYVWLAGRPVVIVRGQFTADWVRQSDATMDCRRNDEGAACGLYFPVTDHIGKPVLMLDSNGRVAYSADYDPFGYPNRVTYYDSGSHPYPNSTNGLIADINQPLAGPAVAVRIRVLFHVLETETNLGTPIDYAWLTDAETGAQLGPNLGGAARGHVWTDWQPTQAGHVQAWFQSDGQNCCPDGQGGLICNFDPTTCPQFPNYPYLGAVVEGYEYQRFQAGAAPFWTPLRFPGQYFDAETDLFENWNRYYDSSIGRYLQPEPLLAGWPGYFGFAAQQFGTQPSPYAYAYDNPIGFGDADGKIPVPKPFDPPCKAICETARKDQEAKHKGRSCQTLSYTGVYEEEPIDPLENEGFLLRQIFLGCACGGSWYEDPGLLMKAGAWFTWAGSQASPTPPTPTPRYPN